MSGLTLPGSFGVVPKRRKEVSRDDPSHLLMQKSVFAKLLVLLKENLHFGGSGGPAGQATSPFCRPQAATASHLDGRKIMLSLGNTLWKLSGVLWGAASFGDLAKSH